jgi:hypothetical protein
MFQFGTIRINEANFNLTQIQFLKNCNDVVETELGRHEVELKTIFYLDKI